MTEDIQRLLQDVLERADDYGCTDHEYHICFEQRPDHFLVWAQSQDDETEDVSPTVQYDLRYAGTFRGRDMLQIYRVGHPEWVEFISVSPSVLFAVLFY